MVDYVCYSLYTEEAVWWSSWSCPERAIPSSSYIRVACPSDARVPQTAMGEKCFDASLIKYSVLPDVLDANFVYAFPRTHIRMHSHAHAHTHTHTHTHTYEHMHKCNAYTCINAHMHTHMHARTRTHTRTHHLLMCIYFFSQFIMNSSKCTLKPLSAGLFTMMMSEIQNGLTAGDDS